eukprot:4244587-Pyramimonas_sp.AAC.1
MRSRPLGPSVELLMGPRSAVLGGADACGRGRWGLRWRATRRCTGWRGRMRTSPRGPSVEP